MNFNFQQTLTLPATHLKPIRNTFCQTNHLVRLRVAFGYKLKLMQSKPRVKTKLILSKGSACKAQVLSLCNYVNQLCYLIDWLFVWTNLTLYMCEILKSIGWFCYYSFYTAFIKELLLLQRNYLTNSQPKAVPYARRNSTTFLLRPKEARESGFS